MSLLKNYSKSHLRALRRKRKIEEAASNLDLDAYLGNTIENPDADTETANNNFIINDDENIDLRNNDSFDNHSNEISSLNEINETDEITSYHSKSNIENDEKMLFAALIATFYSGNLTQTALRTVIEFTQVLTPVRIPKSFDQLISKLDLEKLNYYKIWLCQKCVVKVMLINNKQRHCQICQTK